MYAASQPRDVLRRAAVRELLDGYFDGRESDLLVFLRGEVAPAAPMLIEAEGRIITRKWQARRQAA